MFMVLCIVATPFVFTAWLIQRVLDHRAKLSGLHSPAPQMALTAMGASPEVEQRLANLEAIVASLDFDLATKIREASQGRAA